MLLSRRNGVVVANSNLQPSDVHGRFDENCLLPAGWIVAASEKAAEWMTSSGEPLPLLVVGVTYPGGPVLAIWMGEQHRGTIVSGDHETSSDGYLPVFAKNLGDFFQSCVDEGFDLFDAMGQQLGIVDTDQPAE